MWKTDSSSRPRRYILSMLYTYIQLTFLSRQVDCTYFPDQKNQGSGRIRNWPNIAQLIDATDDFKFPFPISKYSGFSGGSWLPFLTLKNLRSIQGNETNPENSSCSPENRVTSDCEITRIIELENCSFTIAGKEMSFQTMKSVFWLSMWQKEKCF